MRTDATRRPPALLFDLITIDRESSLPVPRQLYRALRNVIAEGQVRPGSRLPATRSFAKALGVGRNSVIAAYEQLLAEGYLEAEMGSGTRIAEIKRIQRSPRASDRSPESGAGPELGVRGKAIATQPRFSRRPRRIDFHPGVPATEKFPFATWAKLLANNARSRSEELLNYYSYAGLKRLRTAIAEYVAVSRGVRCKTDQVIVVNGAQAALDLLPRILADPGDAALMEEPGYIGARAALLACGMKLVPLRVGEKGWDLDVPRDPPARLIYVTPSCQWPYGCTMDRSTRLRLLDLADRHNAWIIEDDYDGEYRFRGPPVPALQGLDRSGRVIYVGTFGKTLFAALRVGFMVVPEELVDTFERAVSVSGHFPSLLIQAALADFIQQGHFATHLRHMRSVYARRQRRFLQLCDGALERWMQVAPGDAGIQLIGRFTQPFDDHQVAGLVRSYGLDVHPLSANFHSDPPQQGLLLGFAKLNDRQSTAAIAAMRQAFEDIETGTRHSKAPPARRRAKVNGSK